MKKKAASARRLVPRETLKLKAGCRKRRDVAVESGEDPRGFSRNEVVLANRFGMLEALARDAGLVGEGGDVRQVLERIHASCRGEGREGCGQLADMYLEFLVDFASGMRWHDALSRWGLDALDVQVFRRRSRDFREMYAEAETARMVVRVPEVVDSLYDLSVNGEERKVFGKDGVELGTNRERSVKAIELFLKAGDRRFADRGAGAVNVGAVTYNIQMPVVALPPPGSRRAVVDIPEVAEADGAVAEALPAPLVGAADLPDADEE